LAKFVPLRPNVIMTIRGSDHGRTPPVNSQQSNTPLFAKSHLVDRDKLKLLFKGIFSQCGAKSFK